MGGGAPAVDNRGDLWVGVGNGSVTSSELPYDHSDAVLELSSSLQLLQYFAPRSWASEMPTISTCRWRPPALPTVRWWRRASRAPPTSSMATASGVSVGRRRPWGRSAATMWTEEPRWWGPLSFCPA